MSSGVTCKASSHRGIALPGGPGGRPIRGQNSAGDVRSTAVHGHGALGRWDLWDLNPSAMPWMKSENDQRNVKLKLVD